MQLYLSGEIYEDNAGGCHLAVISLRTKKCIWYLREPGYTDLMGQRIMALIAGADPIEDCWDGGEPNPQECYEGITTDAEQNLLNHTGGYTYLATIE